MLHFSSLPQVVKVHQNSVNTYLEDIILGSTDRAADQVARQEIRSVAQRVNDVAYAAEGQRTQLQSEEIVAEMVHQFLIPEVQKEVVRERVRQNQRQYLLAAHREIFANSEDVVTGRVTTRAETQPLLERSNSERAVSP